MSAYDSIGEIDAEDLLETLGLGNVSRIGRGEVAFSCPFVAGHAFGDAHPSAHMNEEKLIWRCKGCQRAGSALDLVGAVIKGSPVDALRWLRERYGDSYRPPKGGSLAAEMQLKEERRAKGIGSPQRRPSEDETIGPRGIFTIDWASDHPAAIYMRDRGFSPETIAEWELGFDSWTDRVTIPIRDPEGALVGFKGRTIVNADARYMLLGDTEDRKPRYGSGYGFDLYSPREVVFALDRAIASNVGQRRKVLTLAEGELNAIALHRAGIRNGVAIGTTTITVEQSRLLRWHADELILFYDSDEAGMASTWGYFYDKNGEQIWHPGIAEKLSPFLSIKIVPDHDGDPASMEPEEIVELVASARSWMEIAVS